MAAGDTGAYVFVFDIETTGLDKCDEVTAVCGLLHFCAGGREPEERRYNVVELLGDRAREGPLCAEVVRLLDGARRIVSYNGEHFDLPFLARWAARTGVAADLSAWQAKSLDYYRVILERTGQSYKMQGLCLENALAVEKNGSGLDAVRWARTGEWDKLMRYCMQDVRVLHALLVLSTRGGLRVRQRRAANSAYTCTHWTLAVCEDFAQVHVRVATAQGAAARSVPRVSLSEVLALGAESSACAGG
jgi:uncharacterized protein YprB with RNaseH-like and TPR domain